MALTTQTGVPGVIEAGNTYIFIEDFTSLYPSTLFTMVFVMQLPGNAPISINATANGTAFQIIMNASGYTSGRYDYAEYVTEIASGERATAKTGVLQVIYDLTQTEPQTDAQIMLASITAAIKSLTQRPLISVSVNNVSYTRSDLATLISMRTRLQAEVIREKNVQDAFRGIETSGRISTRFIPSRTGSPFFDKNIGQ